MIDLVFIFYEPVVYSIFEHNFFQLSVKTVRNFICEVKIYNVEVYVSRYICCQLKIFHAENIGSQNNTTSTSGLMNTLIIHI